MKRNPAEPTLPTERLRDMRRAYGIVLAPACSVVAVDQISKALVRANLQHSVLSLPFGAQLDFTRNTGAAFSLFRSGSVLFAVVAAVVSAGILLLLPRIRSASALVLLALGLILGGAVGNLIDRIRLGYVVDFIDLRWWPVFNLADSSVFIGVALLIFESARTRER